MRPLRAASFWVAALVGSCGGGSGDPDAGPPDPVDPCDPGDRDGDGHAAVDCGGDDCDDRDREAWEIAAAPVGSGIWTLESFPHFLESAVESAPVAVDRAGVWHVLFHSGGDASPVHLFGRPGTWAEEALDLGTGEVASLVAAPDGSLHAATAEGYLSNAPGAWVLKPFPPEAGYTLLGVDGHGSPHIVFRSAPAGTIQYGTWVPEGWTTEVISDSGSDSFALAVDSHDRVHVAFAGLGRLWHGVKADGGWFIEDVADADNAGAPTIAVARDGAVHVSFKDGRSLEHATNRSGAWVREYLSVTIGWTGMGWPVLALDPLGRPRIALTGVGGGSAETGIAVRLASGWATQSIARAAEGTAGLAIDDSGAALVAFAAPGQQGGDLMVASTPGLDWLCAPGP